MDIKYVFFYNNVVSELRIRIVCLKPNRREKLPFGRDSHLKRRFLLEYECKCEVLHWVEMDKLSNI